MTGPFLLVQALIFYSTYGTNHVIVKVATEAIKVRLRCFTETTSKAVVNAQTACNPLPAPTPPPAAAAR